ncbi:hypothetical protein BDK51DRAFT_43158 [Blyttiomyces helicus]|uniref:Uncharacterized protein n=1 Tax=Blyttiomyces helicus TaxID=388810 RepID=A0A4P9WPR8_9FUNG|nr:hypothetical protein BDK51DRAFT_43158 [Blyttiomyces helicus]|eukprot:RKO94542.1 hypothetical protein BDK51DRAFT_43158 [Blyttiomyces helicus]
MRSAVQLRRFPSIYLTNCRDTEDVGEPTLDDLLRASWVTGQRTTANDAVLSPPAALRGGLLQNASLVSSMQAPAPDLPRPSSILQGCARHLRQPPRCRVPRAVPQPAGFLQHPVLHHAQRVDPSCKAHGEHRRKSNRDWRTGYTKNVGSFVEYDKKVDEGVEFKIEDAFLSTNLSHYKIPAAPPNYVARRQGYITSLVDSGFTRMPPQWKVTDDGTQHRERNTEMKNNFDARRFQYKSSLFDKACVLPSNSGYVSDAGHIKNLGSDKDYVDRFKRTVPPREPDWRERDSTRMTEDGYTRSHHRDILKPIRDSEDTGKEESTVAFEHARKTDPARWVYMQDPEGTLSTSRIVHRPLYPIAETLSLLNSPIRIGNKEAHGSIRNNPVHLPQAEPNPRERFSTETGLQYTMEGHTGGSAW